MAGSSITPANSETSHSGSSPGRARMSRRTDASAGMTLDRKPPSMMVGEMEVRRRELAVKSVNRSSSCTSAVRAGIYRLR